TDTAFEALFHFVHVFLKAFERSDIAFPNNDAVAYKPRLCLTTHNAVRNAAAGDSSDLRNLERFLNQRLSDDDLFDDRIEHTDHRDLDLFFDLVNDRVQATIDVFHSRDLGGTRFRTNVETDDNDRRRCVIGLCRRSKQNIRFGNGADARPDNAHLDLVGRKFFERSFQNLDRTLNVRLQNNEKFL